MKIRFLSLLLALGMVLSLVACGGQTPEEPLQEETTPVEDTTEEQAPPADAAPVTVDGLAVGTGLMEEVAPEMQLDENPDRDIDRAVEPIKPVPDLMLDGTALGEEFYYYRSTLDPTLQQGYDLLRAGILEGKSKIQMTVPVSVNDIFNLYKAVLYDSPELFWCEVNGARYSYNNKGHVTYLMPGYNDLAKDIPGNTAKLEAALSEALADIWSLPTDAEKAKYAHDYLTHHVNYDLNASYNQTAYSSLVNHASVCAGYAHGFQYLMQQVGIPCAYVLGYAMGGYHAWNVVKLDGEHYAMDVTWDDPLGAAPGKFYYNYFNITDQKIGADHIRADASVIIPAATGTACSFQNAFGGTAYGTDFEAIVGVMPEKIPAESGGSAAEDNPYLS
jgi:predicted small lipoprotein YifL